MTRFSQKMALTASILLNMTVAALAQTYKLNDRVLAPYGGNLAAATIVSGPNSRGEWRVHFDRTDSQRDKWLSPNELRPFVELGAIQPGDVLQADILSAWNWVEVVEDKGTEVLVRKLHHTAENDFVIQKSKLRRAPDGTEMPAAWTHPYKEGEYVRVNKGGPNPEIGRFHVEGDNIYVGDYRVTEMSRILGAWTPMYAAGTQVRNRRDFGVWEKVRIDKVDPGSYAVTLLRTGSKDNVQEVTLAPEWDYDGFYNLLKPISNDQFPIKFNWLMMLDAGSMQGLSIQDGPLKSSLEQLTRVEAQLKAKYPQVPGKKDCYECPAKIMDILARRRQIIMKASGVDAQSFIANQISGYNSKMDDARKGFFWNLPGSFGAVDVAAAVAQELKQNEEALVKDIARNKIIDPSYVFKYDRAPIVAVAKQANLDLAALIKPYQQIASNISQYSTHDATAESLAKQYVLKVDPQAKIVGAFTLQGGWTKDTNVSINTSHTVATITRRLVTSVLVQTRSPKYKYPVVYSMNLYKDGAAPYVHPQSLMKAFYKG